MKKRFVAWVSEDREEKVCWYSFRLIPHYLIVLSGGQGKVLI